MRARSLVFGAMMAVIVACFPYLFGPRTEAREQALLRYHRWACR